MKKLLLTLVAFAVISSAAQAQSLYWNFGTSSGSSTPADTNAYLSGAFGSTYNNNGTTTLLTTTSPSSTYAGASAQFNAGAAARAGALNTAASGSAAFTFTLTADAGSTAFVTGLSFGSRSTGTGPTSYSLQYSFDGFATAGSVFTTGALTGNGSTWGLVTPTITSFLQIGAGQTVTFRLYGYAGTGSPAANTANWRIDDLTIAAVPEPHEYGIALAGLLGVVIFIRRRQAQMMS